MSNHLFHSNLYSKVTTPPPTHNSYPLSFSTIKPPICKLKFSSQTENTTEKIPTAVTTLNHLATTTNPYTTSQHNTNFIPTITKNHYSCHSTKPHYPVPKPLEKPIHMPTDLNSIEKNPRSSESETQTTMPPAPHQNLAHLSW